VKTKLIETGHYDVRGIPVCVGDLIRVKHFRHYRRRQQMWLYFRVSEISGRFVAQNWNDLNPKNWQCMLENCGLESIEILHGETYRPSRNADFIMWCERPRKNAQPQSR